MKRVLIITYYWPPAGGSGVRRWLNFSNLLHGHQWKPVVFHPANAEYPSHDQSLVAEIHPDTELISCPITEPYQLYSRFIGKKGKATNPGVLFQNENPGLKERFSVWIRSNVFIPDAKMLWIRPATSFLKEYLRRNPVDLIVSSGPPHSTHLIAMNIAEKFDLPWIADFRDPWTEIDFFHKLKLTAVAAGYHRKLERKVLRKSTAQISVSPTWGENMKRLGARNVHVITNGFDETNYQSLPETLDSRFTITHLGSINEDRNHPAFWQAISELITENKQFSEKITLQLIGDLVGKVRTDLERFGLLGIARLTPFMNHNDAIAAIAASRVLYLPLNNAPNVQGIIPGKVFEYLAVKRPILAIGPKSCDTAKVLSEAANGIICNFDDKAQIKRSIAQLFDSYLAGTDKVENNHLQQFSRKGLSEKLVFLMNDLTQSKI